MSADENKQDQFLKKAQLWIAVLVGTITLAVGIYNAKSLFFSKKGPGGVSVSVKTQQSQPVAQARVELFSAANAVVVSSSTDAQGEFQKKGLAPGNYSLKITATGYETAVAAIAVQPEETAQFNIVLQSTGSPVKSAIEEVGAGWIRSLGGSKEKEKVNGS